MAVESLRAIETSYRGYRFRSRLEARWAVFFDALNVPWEYEKEGYSLKSGRYLPDFYLPRHKFWIEIKPDLPSYRELRLCRELAVETQRPALVMWGRLSSQPFDRRDDWLTIVQAVDQTDPPDRGIWGFHHSHFPYLHQFGQWAMVDCDCTEAKGMGCIGWRGLNRCLKCGAETDVTQVQDAYAAALSARFEFGESGAVPTTKLKEFMEEQQRAFVKMFGTLQ